MRTILILLALAALAGCAGSPYSRMSPDAQAQYNLGLMQLGNQMMQPRRLGICSTQPFGGGFSTQCY